MHKKSLFLLKNCKNRPEPGIRPQTPLSSADGTLPLGSQPPADEKYYGFNYIMLLCYAELKLKREKCTCWPICDCACMCAYVCLCQGHRKVEM